jgi:hypothetical protein
MSRFFLALNPPKRRFRDSTAEARVVVRASMTVKRGREAVMAVVLVIWF